MAFHFRVYQHTQLVHLQLEYIPLSGYISPEAMATALCTVTSLESFQLEFGDHRSNPGWLPPPMLVVLPVLSYFRFKGASKYLDYLMAHIDAPHLSDLDIDFTLEKPALPLGITALGPSSRHRTESS